MQSACTACAGCARAVHAGVHHRVLAERDNAHLPGRQLRPERRCAAESRVGEGRYSSSGLSRGPYKLRYSTIFSPNPTARSYIDEFFNNASSLATAQSALVVDPGPRTLNVALARGGTISGRGPATGTGRGLAGVAVVARQGGQIQGVVTTDEAGACSVPGLAAGDHTVEFVTSVASEPEVRRYSGELYDNQAPAGVGTPVPVVVEQDTPNINAELALAP